MKIMKKFIQKALACLMALAVVLTVAALPLQTANAATKGVKIYFQNNQGWSKVNAYIWQGSGPVSGTSAWPGATMTKVSGTDNWYELTYTGTSKFNVIFNDGAAKPKQTANHTPADLAADKDAYWFTPSNETSSNDNGLTPAGAAVTVSTTAPAGFPAAASSTPSKASSISSKASSASSAAPASSGTKDSSPKTGDSGSPAAVAVTGTAALGCLIAVLARKKAKA